MHAGGCTLNPQKHSSPVTPCSGGGGAQQYPSGRLATSSAPQPSMAELMAEIAANEYAASGGGGPLVQRAAQVGPAAAVLANVQNSAAPYHTCRLSVLHGHSSCGVEVVAQFRESGAANVCVYNYIHQPDLSYDPQVAAAAAAAASGGPSTDANAAQVRHWLSDACVVPASCRRVRCLCLQASELSTHCANRYMSSVTTRH